ncbi:MAG TPA: helix-turn-helix domain-containing protein [Ktedonobacteraceae bacterium]|jgi:DNA-binding transcriptional ArsR family regulator|nr:helix-turn-helix domain-containing protein [Ktedonobacteraceae bacterium]
MARSRSLPSDLFDDPDFFERDSDTQVILLGLVLLADDYGRGPAHPGLLARKFNKEQATVERALGDLEAAELLQRYSDGRHSYYFLRRWFEWESLSKPARSRYPAPPPPALPDDFGASSPGPSPHARKKFATSGKNPAEEEGRREEEAEKEWEEKEHAKPQSSPGRLLSFKRKVEAPARDADAAPALIEPAQDLAQLTEKVASILRLPSSEALARLVAEYQASPHLSLLGEADAAREYLDDPTRNRRGQAMSLAFFRRWLKREEEAVLSRRAKEGRVVPANVKETRFERLAGATSGPGDTGASAPANPYRTLLQTRAQEVEHIFATTPPEARAAALQHLIQTIAGGRHRDATSI